MSFAYGRVLPAISIVTMSDKNTKEISVFVDESGSFEPDELSSRFYLICMVFHDQKDDLSPWIKQLESFFVTCGLEPNHCVHAGPLIRREGPYATMSREVRQSIFRKMLAFVRKADLHYRCFIVDKHYDNGKTSVHDKLLQEMVEFLVEHAIHLNQFDKLKVYYDNGQSQVKSLLYEAFAMFSSKTEFVPNVQPQNYRLFQAADILCTIELVAAKLLSCGLSTSEARFLGEKRDFTRNILRVVRRKIA